MKNVALLAVSLAACAPSPLPPPPPASPSPVASSAPAAPAEPAVIASAAIAPEEPRLPPGVDVNGAALPDGALARFGSERFRSASEDAPLIFDAKGTAVVLDHVDGRAEVREVPSGVVRRAHPSSQAGALSPDAEVLVTSELELVGVADGAVLRKLVLQTRREVDRRGRAREVTPSVRAVFASVGARTVVVETWEAVFVFDGSTGGLRHTLRLPPPPMGKPKPGPFGPSLHVLALSASGTTLLTDEASGLFATLAWLGGGAAPTDGAAAWDLANGTQMQRAASKPDARERWLSISADGRALLLSRKERTLLVDAKSGQELAEVEAGAQAPSYGAISGDGKLVALARGRSISLRDRGGHELRRFERRASRLALSTDGARIAAASGHTLMVGDAKEGLDEGPPAHDEVPRDAAISPDGQLLATLAPEGLRLWDARIGKHLGFAPLARATHVAFSPRGERLWLTVGPKLVAAPLSERASLREIAKAKGELVALAVGAAGGAVAIARGGAEPDRVTLIDPESGDQTSLAVPHAYVDEAWREHVRALAFSADGAHLVVVAGAVYVFRVADRALVQTLPSPTAAEWTSAHALGGDRVLLSGAELSVLSVSTGDVRPLASGPCPRHATAPKLGRLACISSRKLTVFDGADGRLVVERALPAEALAAPLFTPDGSKVLTFHRSGVGLAWPAR